MGDLICLSVPNFCGNERKYVDEAIDTEWVSTAGQFIGQFEEKMAVELDLSLTHLMCIRDSHKAVRCEKPAGRA